MPWTLYRYMFKELLKLLAITSVVLVFVLATAASIKPLADGLLGPWSLLKFVVYMAPAMLNLALPFAGAFGSTMLFNRMVSDNEIQVCRASGMSYPKILLPVLALGLVLTVSMFYLSNWTIPHFANMAEHALEKDVLSGFVAKVQRDEPIEHAGLVVYADAANEAAPTTGDLGGGATAQRLIALRGLVIGQIDDEGRIRRMGSAQRADMLLYHSGGESWIVLKLKSARYFAYHEGGEAETISRLGPYLVPNPFRERLSFLSLKQLRRLRQWPEDFSSVRIAKQRLIAALAKQELTERIYRKLTGGGGGAELRLQGMNLSDEFVISAPRVQRASKSLKLEAQDHTRVSVKRFAHHVLVERTFLAQAATLTVVMDPTEDDEPRVEMTLHEFDAFSATDDQIGMRRAKAPLDLMGWPDPLGIARPLRSQSLLSLLDATEKQHLEAGPIFKAVALARHRINKLMRQSLAQFHERAALAMGCSLLVILGAMLSLKLQHSTALGVYFWTFLMATVAVIVTRSGKQLVSIETLHFGFGVAVIWSGNLLVTAAILFSFWRLEKN